MTKERKIQVKKTAKPSRILKEMARIELQKFINMSASLKLENFYFSTRSVDCTRIMYVHCTLYSTLQL